MDKHDLLDASVYEGVLARIKSLSAESKPLWGKMSAAQMFAHCAEVQLVANGKPLEGSPFMVKLIAPLIRKAVVNEKAYPHGSRTHPQYVIDGNRDFETEKTRLLEALSAFIHMDEGERANIEHVLFGKLTREEKGWSMYKHIDHHLKQFGV